MSRCVSLQRQPAGVLGAEVCVKLVDADQREPTDPAALTFLTMTTKPSFRAEFKAGEGGKTAVYMARWVNTRGEKGPWSEITTATVAAWCGAAVQRREARVRRDLA